MSDIDSLVPIIFLNMFKNVDNEHSADTPDECFKHNMVTRTDLNQKSINTGTHRGSDSG